MSVPILHSVGDSIDYSLSVEPFIPQLYELPSQLLQLRSLDDVWQLYARTNPLISGFAISLFLAGVFLVASEANRNYSQVDRFWSILPNLYVIHLAIWARQAGLPTSRIDLVAAFTTLWSIRLTFNYWRRGGYQIGSEDYRWEIVKSKIPAVLFFVLNVTFISFMQSILLFAISCVPAYAILLSAHHEPEVTAADVAYFSAEVALIVSEWFSDGQQWRYQTAKHKYYQDAKLPLGWTQADLDRGFNTSGLWAYSRHPNFFAEQTIWLVLYLWGCHGTNSLCNYTLAGSASLILLFQGSTWLTESITTSKYAEYAEYQKQVGRFIPTSLRRYQPPPYSANQIRARDSAKRQQDKESRKQE
ncbi:DUF1295 domain-containing protein [Drechmeria coniospora]|uniref:DUF1295 domain-containing protein n=1 Tax=Drechmeria coniospora TaxID=98403 RepID=A0A151GST1_DRECN|nr:DUF1295 domain-containing protein [Drechmeria coniospora]KYK60157.1 DUF1295 domain-containing protein [Drechmeria coniospora]